MAFAAGDLVILTQAYEEYMFNKNQDLSVSLVNRLAKIEEIIDWNSKKGKIIKAAREKSGKWKGLPIEDNRYILSIYYHDLIGRNKKRGVIQRGVPMFSCSPKNGAPFFEEVPDWMYREIAKKCETFTVELDKDVPGPDSGNT